jgi:hypothetical protein
VAVIAALVWFFYFSDVGSAWLAARLAPSSEAGPVVGKVTSSEGSFKRIHGGGVELLKGRATLEVYDGDRLETDRGAKLVLVLNSTDEIEVKELSAVSVHAWNAKDPASPVYVQWQLGQLDTLKTGVKGKAYIIKEGRRILPTYNSFQLALDLYQDHRLNEAMVVKVALDLVTNYNFGVEELENALDELIRRPILGEKTVAGILPVLQQNRLIRSSFKPTVEPKAIVSSVGQRIFELEGVTEPWVPEHIDYMRDDR